MALVVLAALSALFFAGALAYALGSGLLTGADDRSAEREPRALPREWAGIAPLEPLGPPAGDDIGRERRDPSGGSPARGGDDGDGRTALGIRARPRPAAQSVAAPGPPRPTAALVSVPRLNLVDRVRRGVPDLTAPDLPAVPNLPDLPTLPGDGGVSFPDPDPLPGGVTIPPIVVRIPPIVVDVDIPPIVVDVRIPPTGAVTGGAGALPGSPLSAGGPLPGGGGVAPPRLFTVATLATSAERAAQSDPERDALAAIARESSSSAEPTRAERSSPQPAARGRERTRRRAPSGDRETGGGDRGTAGGAVFALLSADETTSLGGRDEATPPDPPARKRLEGPGPESDRTPCTDAIDPKGEAGDAAPGSECREDTASPPPVPDRRSDDSSGSGERPEPPASQNGRPREGE